MTTTNERSPEFDPSYDVRNQFDSTWVRVLPHREPLNYPKLVRAQLVWGVKVRSGCLPLAPGTGRATRYGCSRRRSAVMKSPRSSRGGQICLSKSIQFVASRRLKKGDPVGVTWTLRNSQDCKRWLLHFVKNSSRYSMPRGQVQGGSSHLSLSRYVSQTGLLRSRVSTTRVHIGIPRGSPRNYPQIRDYYEAYRPLGSQSQRTRNLVRSGGHEARFADSQKRMETLVYRLSDER